jgi:anti-sigma regulatory factor (Ser/Thr protein kinase)
MPLTLEPGRLPGGSRPLPAGLRESGRFQARRRAAGAPYLGGIAFAAGRSVPELLRHLEKARRQAWAEGIDDLARELAGRAALLRGLLSSGNSLAIFLQRSAAPKDGQSGRFGHWLTRLQAAWYAQEPAAALEAAHAAARLAGPQTSTGDLMLFHAFAVSALVRWQDAVPFEHLAQHTAALRYLDERCQASGGALHTLALAACERRRGDGLAALCGFESAAGNAAQLGLHWLAALACEQAAMQADDSGLASAAHHYRRQCLIHYRDWGAPGRVRDLERAWSGSIEVAVPPCRPEADGASRLAMSIVHEINQPLAAVCLHAAAAGKWLRRADPDVERALESLALIGSAGRQAADIVCGLQRLAAKLPPDTAAVDVDEAVRDTLLFLRHRLCEHRVEVELTLGLAGCTIAANPVQLRQLLTNLVVNAIEAHAAAGQAGKRQIRIETMHQGGHGIELAVGDNGPGIDPRHHARVFTSPFSTKPKTAGNVTGMGLSICLSIVRAHGGHAWFEACEPRGACFRVRLPPGAAQAPPG